MVKWSFMESFIELSFGNVFGIFLHHVSYGMFFIQWFWYLNSLENHFWSSNGLGNLFKKYLILHLATFNLEKWYWELFLEWVALFKSYLVLTPFFYKYFDLRLYWIWNVDLKILLEMSTLLELFGIVADYEWNWFDFLVSLIWF